MSLAEYHASPLFAESRSHYPPGIENSGTEGNPGLNDHYHPDPKGPAATGAIALPADWPGNKAEAFRGALPPPY